jgi:hypothetical protein
LDCEIDEKIRFSLFLFFGQLQNEYKNCRQVVKSDATDNNKKSSFNLKIFSSKKEEKKKF